MGLAWNVVYDLLCNVDRWAAGVRRGGHRHPILSAGPHALHSDRLPRCRGLVPRKMPSDYSGVLWIPLSREGWQLQVASEMKAAGIEGISG